MRPSLFEFAGGEAAFLALAAAHHARCLVDPELNHPFSHPGQHPQADHSYMLHLHAGNGDMGDLGRRFIDCFVRAMDDARLPDDPAFRATMRAYMRSAVDEVLAYGPPGTSVASGLPMPHWGWDGPITEAY